MQSVNSIERRRRTVYVAAAAIIAGAMAAFVVTMSLSTSYPAKVADAGPSTQAVPRPLTLTDPAASTSSPFVKGTIDREAVDGGAPDVDDTVPTVPAPPDAPIEPAGRGARGAVLVDDGSAPRSPGNRAALSKEDVREGVNAVTSKVQACYESALGIQPELGGTLRVAFTLEANDDGKGVVTKGEIAGSDMDSPFFEACVLKEIASAEFKAPGGGGVVNVTYPFVFHSDEDGADAGEVAR